MANDPNLFREFGVDLDLTEGRASGVLKRIVWVKKKGTTGKVEPSPQFLGENFTFQREIASAVYNQDIPKELITNLDQTPFSSVSPGKYTFAWQGSSNVPIKGVDDKRQMTGKFAVIAAGNLPMQHIYAGK